MPDWEMPNTWGPESNEMLAELTLEGDWDKVVEIYLKFPEAHTATIKESMGTALHVAIEFNKEDVVKQLVEAIIIEEHRKEEPSIIPEGLVKGTNGRGDTPLHAAASRGFARLCKLIVGPENQERARLATVRNNEGETPLFQAALAGRKTAFAYLADISEHLFIEARDLVRDNGDTILHCVIDREFIDLAVIILNRYPYLSTRANRDGFTPLKVLATRPSAFRSGSSISRWLLILYHCIFVERLDVEHMMKKLLEEIDQQQTPSFPMNCGTKCEFWPFIVFPPLGKLFGKTPNKDRHDTEDPRTRLEGEFLPPNHATFEQFFRSAYMHALAISGRGLKEMREAKAKHTWSLQLLDKLMEHAYDAYTGRGGQPVGFLANYVPGYDTEIYNVITDTDNEEQPMQKETPLLLAARNGISEMVLEILKKLPSTLHDINIKKENLLLVAVLNRKPLIVEIVKKIIPSEVWSNLILAEDENGNTMLHLAARAQDQQKPQQIAGSALQMMWDIKWYEYIKNLVPEHFYFKSNKDKQTPRDIFKETHWQLIKDANEWLKDTSESCSLVAALVAGLSFATATTVPGGYGDNGQPPLEGKPAFDAFTISSLVGLCFSATGLIMFLAILTSRKEARDFQTVLPMKLLLGLSSLFMSIVAMFVSFCSGHFFNVNHKYKDILFPVSAATSLPAAFYAFAQFPLYIDLLTTIFGQVPWAKDKGDNL